MVTPTRRARGTLLGIARLVSRRMPPLAAAVGPLAGPVGDVPAGGRRHRQRRGRVQVFDGRFIREQRRVRTHIVVLNERLSGDHGSFRVARCVLTSVRPMAFLVLSMTAALGRGARLAAVAHATALLRTSCFLLHLGAGTRRTLLGSPHFGLRSMRDEPSSRIHERTIRWGPLHKSEIH